MSIWKFKEIDLNILQEKDKNTILETLGISIEDL